MRRDQRSPEAQAYRELYNRKAWRHRRAQQLAKNPLCERCEKRGLIVSANTANHIIPHKGDWLLFIAGKLESLCASCHSSEVQSEERLGYNTAVDEHGHPLDAKHPWNA